MACAVSSRASGAAAQLGHGAVQHLLRQPARQGFQHGVDVLALGQALAGAGQFQRAPLVGLGVELADEGHRAAGGVALVQPVHEALHAGVDDGLGLRHGGLAAGLAGLHHLGQVVDGVQVDVVQLLDSGSMSRGTARSTMNMGRWRRL
jgi:hypothetical protein